MAFKFSLLKWSLEMFFLSRFLESFLFYMYYGTILQKKYALTSQFKSMRAKYIKGIFTYFVEFLTSENLCFSVVCGPPILVHLKKILKVPISMSIFK